MLQSDATEGGTLSLPAALKRTRCESPGTSAGAPAAQHAGAFSAEDLGGQAHAPASALESDCAGATGPQHAASPPRAGISPIRAAHKSPRWRAPRGSGFPAPGSPLSAGPRQLTGAGAEPAAAAAASPASDADAAPLSQGDAPPPHGEVGADPQRPLAPSQPRPGNYASVPLHCGAFAARGSRPYMEDRHVIVSPFASAAGDVADAHQAGPSAPSTFVGVYDGHNGALAAEYAANHLHGLLAADPALLRRAPEAAGVAAEREPRAAGDGSAPRAAPPPGSDSAVADALVRAFLAVDSQILVASAAGGTREGATALVALRMGGALYTAHAGDSRGVAAVGGRAVRLTRDHTPACAHEAARVRSRGGQLEFAGCWRVVAPPPRGPPRPRAALAVTRALGDLSFKHPTPVITAQPDVGRLELGPEVAFVVLATDGLWDVLTDQDAVDIGLAALAARRRGAGAGAATDRAARALASTLVNTALQRGSSDNITAVVLLLDHGGG